MRMSYLTNTLNHPKKGIYTVHLVGGINKEKGESAWELWVKYIIFLGGYRLSSSLFR